MISKVVPKYYIFILLLEAGVSVLRPEPFVSLVDPSIASSRRGSLSSSGVSAGHLVINRPNTVQSSDANNSECLFSKNTFRSKFRFNIFSPHLNFYILKFKLIYIFSSLNSGYPPLYGVGNSVQLQLAALPKRPRGSFGWGWDVGVRWDHFCFLQILVKFKFFTLGLV